jgi:hypothetical protein
MTYKKQLKILYALDIIFEIARRNKSIKQFYLNTYKYVPQALSDRNRLRIYSIKSRPLINLKERIRLIKIPKNWALGLSSRVKVASGVYWHIPQIDFNCSLKKENLELIKNRLSQIVKIFPGYILKTDKSYHYIGLRILNQKMWGKFIGSSLLCNATGSKSIVDTRWFGYSLRHGYTNLRILATDLKSEPKVVAFVKK